jgi:hypothetical protein
MKRSLRSAAHMSLGFRRCLAHFTGVCVMAVMLVLECHKEPRRSEVMANI